MTEYFIMKNLHQKKPQNRVYQRSTPAYFYCDEKNPYIPNESDFTNSNVHVDFLKYVRGSSVKLWVILTRADVFLIGGSLRNLFIW